MFEADSLYSIQLDMTALQRGSETERWASWAIAIDKGVVSPDEVRAAEGWGHRS